MRLPMKLALLGIVLLTRIVSASKKTFIVYDDLDKSCRECPSPDDIDPGERWDFKLCGARANINACLESKCTQLTWKRKWLQRRPWKLKFDPVWTKEKCRDRAAQSTADLSPGKVVKQPWYRRPGIVLVVAKDASTKIAAPESCSVCAFTNVRPESESRSTVIKHLEQAVQTMCDTRGAKVGKVRTKHQNDKCLQKLQASKKYSNNSIKCRLKSSHTFASTCAASTAQKDGIGRCATTLEKPPGVTSYSYDSMHVRCTHVEELPFDKCSAKACEPYLKRLAKSI